MYEKRTELEKRDPELQTFLDQISMEALQPGKVVTITGLGGIGKTSVFSPGNGQMGIGRQEGGAGAGWGRRGR